MFPAGASPKPASFGGFPPADRGYPAGNVRDNFNNYYPPQNAYNPPSQEQYDPQIQYAGPQDDIMYAAPARAEAGGLGIGQNDSWEARRRKALAYKAELDKQTAEAHRRELERGGRTPPGGGGLGIGERSNTDKLRKQTEYRRQLDKQAYRSRQGYGYENDDLPGGGGLNIGGGSNPNYEKRRAQQEYQRQLDIQRMEKQRRLQAERDNDGDFFGVRGPPPEVDSFGRVLEQGRSHEAPGNDRNAKLTKAQRYKMELEQQIREKQARKAREKAANDDREARLDAKIRGEDPFGGPAPQPKFGGGVKGLMAGLAPEQAMAQATAQQKYQRELQKQIEEQRRRKEEEKRKRQLEDEEWDRKIRMQNAGDGNGGGGMAGGGGGGVSGGGGATQAKSTVGGAGGGMSHLGAAAAGALGGAAMGAALGGRLGGGASRGSGGGGVGGLEGGGSLPTSSAMSSGGGGEGNRLGGGSGGVFGGAPSARSVRSTAGSVGAIADLKANSDAARAEREADHKRMLQEQIAERKRLKEEKKRKEREEEERWNRKIERDRQEMAQKYQTEGRGTGVSGNGAGGGGAGGFSKASTPSVAVSTPKSPTPQVQPNPKPQPRQRQLPSKRLKASQHGLSSRASPQPQAQVSQAPVQQQLIQAQQPIYQQPVQQAYPQQPIVVGGSQPIQPIVVYSNADQRIRPSGDRPTSSRRSRRRRQESQERNRERDAMLDEFANFRQELMQQQQLLSQKLSDQDDVLDKLRKQADNGKAEPSHRSTRTHQSSSPGDKRDVFSEYPPIRMNFEDALDSERRRQRARSAPRKRNTPRLLQSLPGFETPREDALDTYLTGMGMSSSSQARPPTGMKLGDTLPGGSTLIPLSQDQLDDTSSFDLLGTFRRNRRNSDGVIKLGASISGSSRFIYPNGRGIDSTASSLSSLAAVAHGKDNPDHQRVRHHDSFNVDPIYEKNQVKLAKLEEALGALETGDGEDRSADLLLNFLNNKANSRGTWSAHGHRPSATHTKSETSNMPRSSPEDNGPETVPFVGADNSAGLDDSFDPMAGVITDGNLGPALDSMVGDSHWVTDVDAGNLL